ncbi:MAG: zf-HC2 domain-containing protein [Deltaproteobacteria bacterium]|nr:zf-HC2 domain-containing protein [Deltaproteobacteria bacterium]
MAMCPHVERLIPLLHDGELSSPLRREMHAHLVACLPCTRALSLLERGQELISQVIDEEIDSIDFSNFWQGIEEKLRESRPSWSIRFRLWVERWHLTQPLYAPAWAVAAVLLLTIGVLLQQKSPLYISQSPTSPPERKAEQSSPDTRPAQPALVADQPSGRDHSNDWVAFVSNQAQIESLSSSDTVAVWNDPGNNSTVIWIGSEMSEEAP